MSVLRDQFWQFIIATAIALAALAFSIWSRMRRRQKRISYYYFSEPPLSTPEYAANDFAITFQGEPISDLSLVFLRLYNSGDIPILPDEFYSAIVFSFGEKARILTVKDSSSDLKGAVSVEINTLLLAPLMLNKGDAINFHLLVTGYSGRVEGSARIAGVPRINAEDLTWTYRTKSYRFSLYQVVADGVMLFVGLFSLVKGGVFRILGAFIIGIYFANDLQNTMGKTTGKSISNRTLILLQILLPLVVYAIASIIARL